MQSPTPQNVAEAFNLNPVKQAFSKLKDMGTVFEI
jgi:hypothetical protein